MSETVYYIPKTIVVYYSILLIYYFVMIGFFINDVTKMTIDGSTFSLLIVFSSFDIMFLVIMLVNYYRRVSFSKRSVYEMIPCIVTMLSGLDIIILLTVVVGRETKVSDILFIIQICLLPLTTCISLIANCYYTRNPNEYTII